MAVSDVAKLPYSMDVEKIQAGLLEAFGKKGTETRHRVLINVDAIYGKEADILYGLRHSTTTTYKEKRSGTGITITFNLL